MNGKSRCKILKEIRRQIAESNDITFVTSECKYQGDCKGTCPKCEAEVRYLEQELEKRRKQGLSITLAGIATAVTLTAAGCVKPDASQAPRDTETSESRTEETTTEELLWEIETGEVESEPVIYDGAMIDVPRICNLPGMTAEERIAYVAGGLASEFRDFYWKDNWVETRNGNVDVYDFEVDGKRYLALITFDESEVVTHVSLLPFTDETGTVTETTEATGA